MIDDLNTVQQKPAIRLRNGMWIPAFDHKPEAAYNTLRAGLPALESTISICEHHRTVFQAGGNIGMWPLRLSRAFKRVYTFEPVPATFRCLERNTRHATNILRFRSALGADHGVIRMRPSVSSGTWRVDGGEEGVFEVPLTTIDSAQCDDVDAIILDVEGYEVEALRGAARTIERCHPVIHVEELPRAQEAIRAHMRSIGYRMAREHNRDRVYEWEGSSWR
jgi:FkbM family methyltransferase